MSEPLNLTLYNDLVSKKDTSDDTNKRNREKWYCWSYDSFLYQNLVTEKDLFKAIAFAYSWMPTIPKLNVSNDINWNEILAMVQRFQARHDLEGREELLEVLVPIINQSVVGTSKVLHFIAPDKAPIIDSRVIVTWNKVVPSGWS